MNQLSVFNPFIGHYIEVHTIQASTVMTGNLKEISEDCIMLRERMEVQDENISEHYADHIIMSESVYALSHYEGDCPLCGGGLLNMNLHE